LGFRSHLTQIEKEFVQVSFPLFDPLQKGPELKQALFSYSTGETVNAADSKSASSDSQFKSGVEY
jgi:hypothetical protein